MLLAKVKAAKNSKKKGTGGKTLFFTATGGGKLRKWMGNCPLVFMLKESVVQLIVEVLV